MFLGNVSTRGHELGWFDSRKGLRELIRVDFSAKTAIFAPIPRALVDIISYVVEYTGIAIGFQISGVPPIISDPVVFLTLLSLL